MSTAGTVGDGAAGHETGDGDGFTPLSLEEARALVDEADRLDRAALLAERAEAEAQLRAAEETLRRAAGNPTGNPTGITDAEQEQKEPVQNPLNVEVQDDPLDELDVAALREAAARAHAADEAVAAAASEASAATEPADERLGQAEGAFARAMEIREELPATWRRLMGALISATGMAIVVGALGWSVYWLLVPIALIAIMTVDLRLAGRALREASTQATGELAAVGEGGPETLDRIRDQRARKEEAERRLAAARAEREEAYARFEELAPGRLPSEVEEVIAEYEAERAARQQARAEAEAARAEAEAARVAADTTAVEVETGADETGTGGETATPAVPVDESAEPVVAEATDAATGAAPASAATGPEPAAPVTAGEWWFGTREVPPPPPTAAEPVRALAERLSAEGREALARIQAQLDALDRVELAKKSLEWHEANGSTKPADTERH